VFLYNNRVIS